MDLRPIVLSLEVATFATIVATTIGVAVATLLANRRFVGRELVDVLFTAPLVLPPTVLGYYLLVAFGRRSVVGTAYEAIFGSSIVFTRTGAILAASVGALPLVVKAARAALEGVDPTLLMAARTLGATPFRAWRTVQLPLARRGILAAVVLAFARSLGDFGITLMVAGNIPGKTQTAALAIYDALQGSRDHEAQTLVLTMTALSLCLLYLVNRLVGRGAHGF